MFEQSRLAAIRCAERSLPRLASRDSFSPLERPDLWLWAFADAAARRHTDIGPNHNFGRSSDGDNG